MSAPAAVVGVLVVEDHTSFAQALAGMMAFQPDLVAVATVESGEAALDVVEAAAADGRVIDVAVVDLDLPGMPGIDVVVELRARLPAIGIVVLTATQDPIELGRAVEAGAHAVAHKATPIDDVFALVRQVVGGTLALSVDDVTRWLTALSADRDARWEERVARGLLSPRELEVLQRLARGQGSRGIAEELTIAEATVQTHIRNLRAKLGAATRLEAVVEAQRLRLIDPDPA